MGHVSSKVAVLVSFASLASLYFLQYQISILEREVAEFLELLKRPEVCRGSLQSCSLFQDREIPSRLTRNSLCSVNPEFESTFDSRSRDSSLDAYTTYRFLLVSLDLLLRNTFFSILQFLGNLLLDVIGRVYSSFPILHTNLFCLVELDQPIDSPVVAVTIGTRTPD